MASRNRPRNGSANDSPTQQEEQQLWDSIKSSLKKLSAIQKKQIETSKQILELEVVLKEKEKNPGGPTMQELDALQKLYREQLKLTTEEKHILNEEPHDVRHNLEILAALRKASSEEQMLSANAPPHPRSASHSKVRKPKPLGKPLQTSGTVSSTASGSIKDEEADNADTKASAGPGGTDGASDAPNASGLSRVKGSSSVRSASQHSRRDGTVDRELKPPGSSSGTTGEDGGGGGGGGASSELAKGANAERSGRLTKGAEVAYKQAKARDDGSQWIQCTIKQISEKGSTKRYEVQDLFPDEKNGEPDTYRTGVASLIAIPTDKDPLPDYPVGKLVLALYPETNTFYRAEVLGTIKKNGVAYCKLKFEDEEESNKESNVLRRYVLDVGSK